MFPAHDKSSSLRTAAVLHLDLITAAWSCA